MSPERDKLKDNSRYHITHKLSAEIHVARKPSTDRIFGHSNTCDILFDLCRGSLGKFEVAKDFPHVCSTPPGCNGFTHKFLCCPNERPDYAHECPIPPQGSKACAPLCFAPLHGPYKVHLCVSRRGADHTGKLRQTIQASMRVPALLVA
jgi:hypothetical protein